MRIAAPKIEMSRHRLVMVAGAVTHGTQTNSLSIRSARKDPQGRCCACRCYSRNAWPEVKIVPHPEDVGSADRAQMLRQAAEKTGEAVGDGTSTSTVLEHAKFADGTRNVVAGASGIGIKVLLTEATMTETPEEAKAGPNEAQMMM